MRLFLLLLSIGYLLVEILFNINFINILSTNTMYQYENIDVVGRSISSFGASILLLRFLFFKRFLNSPVKRFSSFFIIPLFFICFYLGQEKLVDHIVDISSVDIKSKYSKLFIYQKGYFNDSNSISEIPVLNNSKHQEVLISTIGFWTFGIESVFNSKINEKLYSSILARDMINHPDAYYSEYEKSKKIYDSFVSKYTNSMKELFDRKVIELMNNMPTIFEKKRDGELKLIKNYDYLKNKFLKEVKKEKKNNVSQIYDIFYMYTSCSDSRCRDTWGKKFNNLMISKNLNSMTISSFCKNNKYSTSYYQVDSKIINSKKGKSTVKRTGISAVSCYINTSKIEQEIHNKISEDYYKQTGISNFNLTKDQFVNNGGIDKALMNKLKMDYDIVLPKNWKRTDMKALENALNVQISNKVNKEGLEKIKEEIGFEIPLFLKEKDLIKNKNVSKYLEDNLGIYYNNGVKKLDKNEFVKEYEKIFKDKSGYYYLKNLNNNDYLDYIYKMSIIPLISIILSLSFGVINFIFITKEIISISYKKKCYLLEYSILITLFFFFSIIPFYFNNHYGNYIGLDNIFNEIENNNKILSYFYKWFLNVEGFIYSHLSPYFLKINIFKIY